MSTTTWEPIEILLNTDDEQERDDLTKRWRDHKLSELNFVGIVGALLTGCLTSTGSWPTILPDDTEAPWTVRTSWYCGIVLSLASVLMAAHQTIRLHRLSAHRDSMGQIRSILASRGTDKQGRVRPRLFQVWVWEMPVYFLTLSAVALMCGLFILMWSATGTYTQEDTWWDGYAKVAVTVTVVTSVSLLAFFTNQITLYMNRDGSIRL